MVLDAGRIVRHQFWLNSNVVTNHNIIRQVEFDSPKELLKMKDSRLRALVDSSGDRDTLYAMAEGKITP
jgi:hypothetical protein